ncbi:hypothetical protein HOI71_15085, partial [Candidatus Poribacteria bacterium]|nr:hypothetical protein [Candidatus Poribacteria bacterium]
MTTATATDVLPLPARLTGAAAATQYAKRMHEHIQELLGAYLNLRGVVKDVRQQRFDVARYRRMEETVVEGGIPGREQRVTMADAVAAADRDIEEFDTWARRVGDQLLIGLLDESAREQWSENVAFARAAFYNDALFRHLYDNPRTPWASLRGLLSQGVGAALA